MWGPHLEADELSEGESIGGGARKFRRRRLSQVKVLKGRLVATVRWGWSCEERVLGFMKDLSVNELSPQSRRRRLQLNLARHERFLAFHARGRRFGRRRRRRPPLLT